MPNETVNTRRSFVISGVAAGGAAGARFKETLALDGGSKSVTFPAEKASALFRWPRYGPGEKQALHEMIDSGKYYDELPLFEKDWQAYTKAPYVKAHMNGSSALTSMYFALDLPPGSEIMVPSYTFYMTCLAMRFFGCVPIFIDIDKRTGCFDLEDARRKLTPRTRALCVMHSWGLPCEMDHIAAWAREKGLILLEDAAHAHGAEMQGKAMGNWGEMGIYSFQASKLLPAIEGGMGMYQKREHFERAAAFGEYLDPVKFPADSPVRAYEGTGFGQKYRMHPFSAAVLRRHLKGLDERNAVVAANARRFYGQLAELPGLAEPRCRPDQKRAYYYATLLLADFGKIGAPRGTLMKALHAEGVRVTMWDYPQQHKLKIYSEAKWWHHKPELPASLPGTEWINANHVFLPNVYGEAPELIEQYVNAFRKVWAHRDALAKT
jgi:dTDP-4-amino-4,6-dideoxygalactose transaminase